MNIVEEFRKATIVLLAISAVACIIELAVNSSFGLHDAKDWIITNIIYTYPFYFSNLFLNGALDKWLPWEASAKKRAVLGTIITVLVNLFVVCVLVTLHVVLVHGGPVDYIFSKDGKTSVVISLVIVIFITLVFYAFGFFREMQNEKLINESLRKEKVSAELNALKSQLDPHFLFNSFNVLSGLIDEDPGQAQKFLSKLSKIYRYVLESPNEEMVDLSQELEFAQQYLALQKIRFEDSILIDIAVSEDSKNKKLPSLSLQLLLENAIKHNSFDKKQPLKISIVAANNMLQVSNSKQRRTQLAPSNGIGLKNIKQRYNLHNIAGIKIEDTATDFIVHLPLIN